MRKLMIIIIIIFNLKIRLGNIEYNLYKFKN